MTTEAGWVLLVLSLPTASATGRMRIWRALKALGCAALRDGAYLLPAGVPHLQALREQADDCIREGGAAWLMAVQAASDDEDQGFRALFERGAEWAEMRRQWQDAQRALPKLSAAETGRLQRRLTREYEALRAIDFFPGDSAAEAEVAWLDLLRRIQAVLSPDEPQEAPGHVPRLELARYQGRTWATRRHLWVDRVASAWLIRRFIDPKARFKWLATPADCPKSALGFDFDGAAFTHVGERVTFETLLASFGLEEDAALARLGAMVHQLDVGGDPVAEAQGFESILAGARERHGGDDDTLLAEISLVLDSLYAHFQRPAAAR